MDLILSKRALVTHLASVMLLLALCSHAVQAAGDRSASAAEREVPAKETTDQNRNSVRVALLTPAHSLRSAESDVREEDLTWDIAAKWRDVLARIETEGETLAACRTSPDACSEAARRFLELVGLGRERAGRARLAEINRAANLTIKAISDRTQYGVNDFWSSPLSTLQRGAGDCEDYAILKYLALREAGMSPDDLRLLIVSYPRRNSTHVVLAAHVNGEWLLLDNLTTVLVNSREATHYRPLVALDQHGIATLPARSAVAGLWSCCGSGRRHSLSMASSRVSSAAGETGSGRGLGPVVQDTGLVSKSSQPAVSAFPYPRP